MFHNDDPWTVWLQTNTRDDFIKAAAILGCGLERMCLNGQENYVLIKGGGSVGKSLVVDTMTLGLTDGQNDNVPTKSDKSMFEDSPSEAAMIEKGLLITHLSRPLKVSFFNAESGDPYQGLLDARQDKAKSGPLGYIRCLFNILQRMNKEDDQADIAVDGSLIFISSFEQTVKNKGRYALMIDIRGMNSPIGDPMWGRRWEVSVPNLSFRTPQMFKALSEIQQSEKVRVKGLRHVI